MPSLKQMASSSSSSRQMEDRLARDMEAIGGGAQAMDMAMEGIIMSAFSFFFMALARRTGAAFPAGQNKNNNE
jgi:hypothetical protein